MKVDSPSPLMGEGGGWNTDSLTNIEAYQPPFYSNEVRKLLHLAETHRLVVTNPFDKNSLYLAKREPPEITRKGSI
jgi:hypothetical protein